MAQSRIPKAESVCVKCLEENPRNLQLMQLQCINQGEHLKEKYVYVWIWKSEGILELYPRRKERPSVRSSPVFLNFRGKFRLCHRACSPPQSQCLKPNCNHAHSVEEMERWNEIKTKFTKSTLTTHNQHRHPFNERSLGAQQNETLHPLSSETTRPSEVTDKKKMFSNDVEKLSNPLSQTNYKEKLRLLLNLEQVAHKEELQMRCDGDYILKVDRQAHPSTRQYLVGLNGDQISYATQASRKVLLTIRDASTNTKVSADILPNNYSHTEEKLYLGFSDRFSDQAAFSALSDGARVTVKFELKHQYFDRLRDSVDKIPSRVVSRIVPDGFPQKIDPSATNRLELDLHKEDLSLELCSEDQLDALQAMPITFSSKGEPPFLLTGPFGSGKTRLLAVAAHISFRSSSIMKLLVCVQQHVSADAFLSCFNEFSDAKDVYVVQVVTESKYNQVSSRYDRPNCMTVSQLQEKLYILNGKNKLMIIATCSTAINLQYKKVFRIGYFSHIYIDEGAQMREPEAIAPLGFATEDTILVMAGDQHQVGPAMLVLGDIPQEHGLSVSLVERLHGVYRATERPFIGLKYHRALTTHFRCHPVIMKLSGELFYKANLKCRVVPHDKAPYPFHFICSDVDISLKPIESGTVYPKEADILAQEMVKCSTAGKVFPLDGSKPDTSQFAYASPCRSQLSTIEKYVKVHQNLKRVNKVPIYDIQGNEYRALFLSTTEPTNNDGSTRNPTKSICDPFVFNTVISRARSMIISAGNPFILLRKEKHMVKKYGVKAKCWSSYIKLCLEHGTIRAAPLLKLKEEEWQWNLDLVKGLVRDNVASGASHTLDTSADNTDFNSAAAATVGKTTGESQSPLPPVIESPSAQSVSVSDTVDSVTVDQQIESTQEKERIPEEVLKIERRPSLVVDEAKFTREFKIIGRLGKGGYGVVYRVKNNFDDGDYAVKIIKLNPQSRHDIKGEVRALAKLNNPRIVRYFASWTETLPSGWENDTLWADLKDSETYTQRESQEEADSDIATVTHMATLQEQWSTSTEGSFDINFKDSTSDDTTRKSPTSNVHRISTSSEESEPKRKQTVARSPTATQPTCLFIQTELCKRGTLRDWLTDHTDSRLRKKVLQFTKQMLEAVDYIHKKKLIHRDLKPSNILFDKDESDSLKVGDFGLVTPWEQPKQIKAAMHAASPKSASRSGGKARQHTVNAGTELYRSPEQRAKQIYNSKVDIFALGLIIFELNYPMITGHQMNKVFSDLREKGSQGFPEGFERSLPNEARLIGVMVSPNPAKRPTAKYILEGEALKKIEEDVKAGQVHVPFEN